MEHEAWSIERILEGMIEGLHGIFRLLEGM